MRNLSPFRLKKTFLVVNKSVYCGEAAGVVFYRLRVSCLEPRGHGAAATSRAAATKAALFFSSFQSTTRSVIAHSIMVLYFDPKCMNWLRTCLQEQSLYENIHYNPLMMSQKEEPMGASWVLPRKVAEMV